jgi:hypothetical protein
MIAIFGKKINLKHALLIITVLSITLSLMLSGCSANGSGKGGSTVPDKNTVADQEDKQEKAMADLRALVEGNSDVKAVIEFIDNNISAFSKENASLAVSMLEEIQQKSLSALEDNYNNDDVQSKINEAYGFEVDLSSLDGINDSELKTLLEKTRDTGYRVETAEGMYFPVIDYGYLQKYSPYVTDDMKGYIDIMAMESGKWPAKDAALVIGWDEIVERAQQQEKFIEQYPDSPKTDDIKQLYKKYTSFILYGLNNTPLFDYSSKTMSEEAKKAYTQAVKGDENSRLLKLVRSFLEVLEQNSYKLTDKVEEHRKSALDSI